MNRINCSESAADLLRQQWPELPLRDRGEISVKGKGKMNCFWVNETEMNAKTDAAERLEAKRKLHMLESSIENWAGVPGQGVDVEKGLGVVAAPEQALPRMLTTLAETSEEFSSAELDMPEQAPCSVRKLVTLAESNRAPQIEDSNDSHDTKQKPDEAEGSAEFVDLGENLKKRLGRSVGKGRGEYFV